MDYYNIQSQTIEIKMEVSSNSFKNNSVRQLETGYQRITIERRRELIRLVSEEKLTVYRASKMLRINHSTAKAIIKKYRNSGHVFVRKSEKGQEEGEVLNRNQEKEEENRKKEENQRTEEELSQRGEKEVKFCVANYLNQNMGVYWYSNPWMPNFQNVFFPHW